MELKQIIKSDQDRLFVLDYECFIIFTADDLTDKKPFIRIGNWIDLPPACIPFIENIVVTDSITGNPSYEQFNIDPKYLSTNCYIGSRLPVKNYLDFQKNFGLNLNNVSIVEVEKDLPSLSKEKPISSKDAFIGIFYYSGNFKVEYNDKNLFDLKEYEDKSDNPVKLFELISNKNKDALQYAGGGLVIIKDCPLFYKNRYFSSYNFSNELEDYNRLNIDPAKIREILLPSQGSAGITDFIKWKNNKGSLTKIFSNLKAEFDSLQKLYPNTVVKRENFKACAFDTGEGLSIENYADTINLRLTYKNIGPSNGKLKIAYMREYSGLQRILKEELDCIIIPYTIFEKAGLFFKTSACPVVCINDGNKNIVKLKAIDSIILNDNIIYEFKRFDDVDSLVQMALKYFSNKSIIDSLNKKNVKGISEFLFNENEKNKERDIEKKIEILNACSILRIYLNTTTDRKFSSEIRRILPKALSMFDKINELIKEAYKVKTLLFFFHGSIFDFYESINKYNAVETKSGGEKSGGLSQRIELDRIRFNELLALYDKIPNKSRKEFTEMTDEIKKRKQDFRTSTEDLNLKEIKRTVLKMRLKKVIIVFSVVLALIIIYFASTLSYRFYKDYTEKKRIETERLAKIEEERRRTEKEKKEKEELITKYDIHVSDRDIYYYANDVARKNGYREIEYKDLKEKNPNWIFPGNIFYLMDGEKVVVKYGDTLWDISDKKLMGINLEFYKLIDKIKAEKNKEEKLKSLEAAKKLAFSKKHQVMINSILKEPEDKTSQKAQ